VEPSNTTASQWSMPDCASKVAGKKKAKQSAFLISEIYHSFDVAQTRFGNAFVDM
jgi:hypothetical protein